MISTSELTASSDSAVFSPTSYICLPCQRRNGLLLKRVDVRRHAHSSLALKNAGHSPCKRYEIHLNAINNSNRQEAVPLCDVLSLQRPAALPNAGFQFHQNVVERVLPSSDDQCIYYRATKGYWLYTPFISLPAERDSASEGQPFFKIRSVRGPAWSRPNATSKLIKSLDGRHGTLKPFVCTNIYGG